MSFDKLPLELRLLPQWIVWRLELKPGSPKPTKVPYNVDTGHKASVTNPSDWFVFDKVVEQLKSKVCREACDSSLPTSTTGYSGIGFVFTSGGGYTGIDLDDCEGNAEHQALQQRIYKDFNSYSEISQSGKGLHIIVKGVIPRGRRRNHIEVYSDARYFVMTGNVYQDHNTIEDRQEQLTNLWEEMGGDAESYVYGEDQEEKHTDEEILSIALQAANGDKFKQLLEGNWQELYGSQSEADFAFVDIVAFYTQNRNQIARIFKASALGQTPKDNYAHRGDRVQYVKYMVDKSFDRQLPPIDADGLRIQIENKLAEQREQEIEDHPDLPQTNNLAFPPGLVGEIAKFIYQNSPTPVFEIALAGAIGLMAGICGRSYNISGTGLNQYVLVLANTGAGKEAMANGIGKIRTALRNVAPTSIDFTGPGEIASAEGLAKAFGKSPCFYSIVGEFGLFLKNITNQRNYMGERIKRILLHLYNKSGKYDILDGTVYSDNSKNIAPVIAPCYTIIGESAPVRFYEALDENMVLDGLLPRFLIFEYRGPNPYYVERNNLPVPIDIIENLANLVGVCSARQATTTVQDVEIAEDCKQFLRNYSYFCTDKSNSEDNEVTRYLWSRAHIKVLKLSALIAVGINWHSPTITLNLAKNVIDMVNGQIEGLIKKFKEEEVGGLLVPSESQQMKLIVKCIKEYCEKGFDYWKIYQAKENMHADKVIPVSVIQRKLISAPAFTKDRIGATNAIKRTMQELVDADAIREMPKAQVSLKYGNKIKCYVVADPARFWPEK